MTRICVIGDSHVAAIKLAWDAIHRRYSQFSLTFVAAPGPLLSGLRIEPDRLWAEDERLAAFLERTVRRVHWRVDEFDLFYVVGLGLGMDAVCGLFKKHIPETLAEDFPDLVPITERCMDLSMQGLAGDALGTAIVRQLATECGLPVVVQTAPRWSVTLTDDTQVADIESKGLLRRSTFWRRAAKAGFDGIMVEAYEKALRTVVSGHATVLHQPPATLDGSLTHQRFRSGQTLTAERDTSLVQRDFKHANAEFGELVLDQFFAAVSAPGFAAGHATRTARAATGQTAEA